jgi:cell division protein FtsL
MSSKQEPSWELAIIDAENEIQHLNRQIRRLQQAKRIFKINKKEGVPWPTAKQENASE